MMGWGNLEADDNAWETAKRHLKITDARYLTPAEFHDLTALAQGIKEGTVNLADIS